MGGTPNGSGTPGAPSLFNGTPGGMMAPQAQTSMISTVGQNQQTAVVGSNDAITNLIGWYQETIDEGRQGELEIFISGGGFSYKKACLAVDKLQESADGAIMVKINVPIDETSTYTVFIPKKLF